MFPSPIMTGQVFIPPYPGNFLEVADRLQDLGLDELLLLLNQEPDASTSSDKLAVIAILSNLARTDPTSAPEIVKALIGKIQGNENEEVERYCVASSQELIAAMIPEQATTALPSIMGILGHEGLGVVAMGFLIRFFETNGDELLPILLESLAEQTQLTYPNRNLTDIRHLEHLLKVIEVILVRSSGLTEEMLMLVADALKNAWENEEARREAGPALAPMNLIVLGNVLVALVRRFKDDDFIDFLIEKALEQGYQESNDVSNGTHRVTAPIVPIFTAAVEALLLYPSSEWIQPWVDKLIDFIEGSNGSYSIVWMLGKIARFKPAAIPENKIPTLVTTIGSYLNSQNLQLRWRSMEAWGGMWRILDPGQQTQTLAMLQQSLSPQLHWMSRIVAAQTLGEISAIASPEVVDSIATILMVGRGDRGANGRLAIVQALSTLVQYNPAQTPQVFKAFVETLNDLHAAVREAAARALQNLIRRNPAYAATQLQATVKAVGKAITLTPPILSPLHPYHRCNPEILALDSRARFAAIQVLRDIATVSLLTGWGYGVA